MGRALNLVAPDGLDIERIRQQTQELIANGKTLHEIAAAIGRSDSALSQFLSGKYPGETANMKFAYRLQVYLDLERQRNETPEKPPFVETSPTSAFSLPRSSNIKGLPDRYVTMSPSATES